MHAKLPLDLPQDDLKKLSDAIEADPNFKTIQNKMRASVLLCTQELMNSTKDSAFEQFNLKLPEDPNVGLALAVAVDFLSQRKLLNTVSVLQEEVNPDVLDEGKKQLSSLASDASGETVLERLISVK